MEVKQGYTKLIVPHKKGKLSIIAEPVKGNYNYQREQLNKMGFPMITSPEEASFLLDVYKNPNGEEESKIINIISKFYTRSSTENLWLPESKEEISDGVICYDNFDTSKEKFSIEKSELISKLSDADEIRVNGHPIFISKDGTVRYTPFGFKTGEMNSFKLAKNAYNIARHGEEGAENIAEVSASEKYKNLPFVYAFESINKEKRTLSALNYGWYIDWGLDVYGDGSSDDAYTHGFGVSVAD